MADFSDWESAEDSVYDAPRFKADKESRQKAMQKYLELSQQLEDNLVAEMGQEEYDASQHWINNPLIKPRSKVAMFEDWEERIREEKNEHVIKLLEEHVWQLDIAPSGKWEQRCRCGFYGVFNDHLIALIKGEK